MLLRYAMLHGGLPRTNEQWSVYGTWKRQQSTLPECQMAQVDGAPDPTLKCGPNCRLYGPGCPKYPFKRSDP